MSALAELTAGIIPGMDFVEEVIPLAEGELALLRPRDSEALPVSRSASWCLARPAEIPAAPLRGRPRARRPGR